jgi:hypothetical protein
MVTYATTFQSARLCVYPIFLSPLLVSYLSVSSLRHPHKCGLRPSQGSEELREVSGQTVLPAVCLQLGRKVKSKQRWESFCPTGASTSHVRYHSAKCTGTETAEAGEGRKEGGRAARPEYRWMTASSLTSSHHTSEVPRSPTMVCPHLGVLISSKSWGSLCHHRIAGNIRKSFPCLIP